MDLTAITEEKMRELEDKTIECIQIEGQMGVEEGWTDPQWSVGQGGQEKRGQGVYLKK